ncbi:outer membrane beta-barrel protein [Bradyrhizobium sp. BR13661]|jgi:outer membrane immunogenic protein|uniref:outer membrane protein n=1 Tax=Bradyrhizobium sp. BR13661 TaxID=2940622 RepID=UPI002473A1B6|nr:outer membrane beta-barrel protein [Bradyrhizobium sp. BR13661]MDH6258301.1 outer membrane immunogenic protein [Bradyrhizobium sp. BR13661]
MKKALAAALLVLGGCVSADAGEINWTGFYAGLNGGYGWARGGVTALPGDALTQSLSFGQPVVPPVSASLNANGGLGGGQVGYDWQFAGRGVVGVEADIAATSLKSSASVPLSLFGTQPATFNVSRNIDWVGTVRGRIGFLASPDLLLFATGGFAYGRVGESASVSLPAGASNSIGNFGYAFACGPFYGFTSCFAGSSSRIATGWAAGIGGEKRFTQNLSLKVEYLHVDLGSSNYPMIGSLYGGTPFAPSFLNARSSTTIDLVRAGLNYNF